MQPKGVVFDGKTLDEAVRKGMEALGLSRAEVMITVLEEGSGGFLGIGARPYRVRMMPRPARELSERPPGRERESREGREGRGDRGGRGRSSRGDGRGRRERGSDARGPRVEARGDGRPREGGRAERGGDGRREARGGGRGRSESAAAAGAGAPEMPRAEGVARGPDSGEGRGRPRRPRGRAGEREPMPRAEMSANRPMPIPEPASVAASPAPRMAERRPAAPTPVEEGGMSAADLERTACQVTEDLLRAMGFTANVTARSDGDTAEVRAEVPEHSDLLVGPKGEVRQALQHLLNRTLNRGGGSRYHLQLEINDFWQQREDELRSMALRLADEAVADGTEKLTEYLNSQERRVVHMSLRDHPAVSTHAIGDGLIKKIAITPGGESEGAPREE